MLRQKLEGGTRDVDVPRVREYQRPVYEAAARFKVLICGRRWGKSKIALLCAVNGHGPAVDGTVAATDDGNDEIGWSHVPLAAGVNPCTTPN